MAAPQLGAAALPCSRSWPPPLGSQRYPPGRRLCAQCFPLHSCALLRAAPLCGLRLRACTLWGCPGGACPGADAPSWAAQGWPSCGVVRPPQRPRPALSWRSPGRLWDLHAFLSFSWTLACPREKERGGHQGGCLPRFGWVPGSVPWGPWACGHLCPPWAYPRAPVCSGLASLWADTWDAFPWHQWLWPLGCAPWPQRRGPAPLATGRSTVLAPPPRGHPLPQAGTPLEHSGLLPSGVILGLSGEVCT